MIATFAEIESLVAAHVEEGPRLEFKTKLDSSNRQLAREVSAFANTEGGELIIGIRERNSTAAGIEWCADQGVEERILAILGSHVSPTLISVVVHRIPNPSDQSEALYVVDAPKSFSNIHMVDGRYYKRRGSSTVPMSHDEVLSGVASIGRRLSLTRELVRNRALLQRTQVKLETLFVLVPEDRNPLVLVPFQTGAWQTLLSTGLLLTYPGVAVERLTDFYGLVHDFNALVPLSFSEMSLSIIHSPVERSTSVKGTYYPRIMADLSAQLYGAMSPLVEMFSLEEPDN